MTLRHISLSLSESEFNHRICENGVSESTVADTLLNRWQGREVFDLSTATGRSSDAN